MLSAYDVKKYLNNKKDDATFPFYEMDGKIYDKEDDKEICDLDFYVDYLRKKLHCSFETVYYNHGSLTEILRCTECGAIIFTGDDERYDPNLCCPVCSGYNHNDYWTAEDIKNDPQKQKQIEFYEEWTKAEIEAEKRRKARGGLYDWQIFKKDYYGKKKSLHLELTKMCGYMLEVRIGTKDGMGYIVKTNFKIPLSPRAFYIRFIYPIVRKFKNSKDTIIGFISNMERHEYVDHDK